MEKLKQLILKNFDRSIGELASSFAFLLLLSISFGSCSPEENSTLNEEYLVSDLKAPVHFETWQDQIAWLTQKTTRFHNFQVAIAQGWNVDATGYLANMGHHYINMDYADGTFELLKPEMLLYVPDGHGGMKFVGVEYLVFVADPSEPGAPPEGFIGDADEWSFNTDVGAWTLHAWVGLENKAGVFYPTNSELP